MNVMTKERAIALKGDEVRAVLDGRKTQFRRVIAGVNGLKDTDLSFAEPGYPSGCMESVSFKDGFARFEYQTKVDDTSFVPVRCPFGQPGDRLWVQETWAPSLKAPKCQVAYAADDHCYGIGGDGGGGFVHVFHGWLHPSRHRGEALGRSLGRSLYSPWKSSTQMPRWASRITLEITDVRVELLRSISSADCIAEGMRPTMRNEAPARERFRDHWEAIHGKGSWDASPWVWAISFRRVEAAS